MTEDGAETDLDLGHYERFTNSETSGTVIIPQAPSTIPVIMKERKEVPGKTVQVIHLANEIIRCIPRLDSPDTDVVISENRRYRWET